MLLMLTLLCARQGCWFCRSALRRRRPQTGARGATERSGRCMGGVTGRWAACKFLKSIDRVCGSEGVGVVGSGEPVGISEQVAWSRKTSANPRAGGF